jgi:hypothetical protein
MTTISEILPMIDEAVQYYEKYRPILQTMGGVDVTMIAGVIKSFGAFAGFGKSKETYREAK